MRSGRDDCAGFLTPRQLGARLIAGRGPGYRFVMSNVEEIDNGT
ncbi:hypothetical protein [Burkholderia gladioli]|nr:hypothetical protein [Burkholderia gladioli]